MVTVPALDGESIACVAQGNRSLTKRWVMDSGCTDHLSPNLSDFTTYTPFESPRQIALGNSTLIKSLGEGTVLLNCIVEGKPVKRTVNNVQYVPDLMYGLLSGKCLNRKGFLVVLEGGGCKIIHRNGTLLVEALPTSGRLYFLNLAPDVAKPTDTLPLPPTATLATTPSFDLVHKRLAHPGKDALHKMIKGGLAGGLTGIIDESNNFDCDACIRGKVIRAPFQSGHLHANKRLGRLHSDVCGPMDVASLGGSHYFCILVDDQSGYIWYHAIAKKSDFSMWFIKMDKLFINQYQTHVKILRSDGGGEYVNSFLESYCADNGIIMERTVAHTPEQNGVAEQANRKIEDKLWMLIKDANAPLSLWADAGAVATYAINRTVSASSQGVTPYEAFHGIRPSINHMRVWYCDAYIH